MCLSTLPCSTANDGGAYVTDRRRGSLHANGEIQPWPIWPSVYLLNMIHIISVPSACRRRYLLVAYSLNGINLIVHVVKV